MKKKIYCMFLALGLSSQVNAESEYGLANIGWAITGTALLITSVYRLLNREHKHDKEAAVTTSLLSVMSIVSLVKAVMPNSDDDQ